MVLSRQNPVLSSHLPYSHMNAMKVLLVSSSDAFGNVPGRGEGTLYGEYGLCDDCGGIRDRADGGSRGGHFALSADLSHTEGEESRWKGLKPSR